MDDFFYKRKKWVRRCGHCTWSCMMYHSCNSETCHYSNSQLPKLHGLQAFLPLKLTQSLVTHFLINGHSKLICDTLIRRVYSQLQFIKDKIFVLDFSMQIDTRQQCEIFNRCCRVGPHCFYPITWLAFPLEDVAM